MTSLLSEALGGGKSTQHRVATLDDEIDAVEQTISDLRSEIGLLLAESYADMLPSGFVRLQEFNSKCDRLAGEMSREIDEIRAKFEKSLEGVVAAEQMEKVKRKLDSNSESLSAISSVSQLAKALHEIDILSPAEHPLQYTEAILNLEAKLNKLEDANSAEENCSVEKVEKKLDNRIFPPLREELIIQKELVIYELLEWWAKAFHWVQPIPENQGKVRKNDPDQEPIGVLLIELSQSEAFDNGQRLKALNLMGFLERKMAQFGEFLLCRFCEPLISQKKKLHVEMGTILKPNRHTISLFTRENPAKKPPKLDGKDVFWSLTELFDGLFASVGKLKWLDGESGKEVSFLSILGGKIGEKLLENLVKNVLKPAIPFEKGENEEKEFNKIVDAANIFEIRLQEIAIFPSEQKCFEKLAENFDTLFIDRRCQKILGKGRKLILANLHQLVTAGSNDTSDLEAESQFEKQFSQLRKDRNSDETFEIGQLKLPRIFHFPKCQVSQSAVDFMNLLEATLEESISEGKTAEIAGRLFQIGRNLCELFLDLSFSHHEYQLKTVPQIAAVFYNNCYFLANRLMTLGYEVSPKLKEKLEIPPNTSNFTFADFIPRLRELASDCMESHLVQRKREIDREIRGQKLFAGLDKKEPYDQAEKALNSCLLQVEQLYRVWSEVLTENVLSKAVGQVCGHFLSLLTTEILLMEDVSAKDADAICLLYGANLKSLERLFLRDGASELSRVCPSVYERHRLLLRCVGGTLRDFVDLWCDGKGPLAAHLEASEVRSLVKALFQNTERRAQVLAKIK